MPLTPVRPPAEEFQKLSSAEVEAAIGEAADPKNPIALEITRLVAAYANTMVELVEQCGKVPEDFVITPRFPIEDVAKRLFNQTRLLREIGAAPGGIANDL